MEQTELVIFICLGAIFYLLGRVTAQIKQNNERSTIAMFASLFAATEATGIRNAPVLRQVIERYVPVAEDGKDSQEKLEEKMLGMQEQFNELFGFNEVKKFSKNGIKPEDTV